MELGWAYGGSRNATSYGALGGRSRAVATEAGDDVGPGEAEGAGVGGDQRGGTPVLLDERDDPGPARPGLEPDRPGAGVQVEEAEARQRAAPRLDGREQRLAHAVAGRAGVRAARRRDPPTARRSPDDPRHGLVVTLTAVTPRDVEQAVMTSP